MPGGLQLSPNGTYGEYGDGRWNKEHIQDNVDHDQQMFFRQAAQQYQNAANLITKNYRENGGAVNAAYDKSLQQQGSLSDTAMQTMDELKKYLGINAPGETGFTGEELTNHIMSSPEYKARFEVGKQAMERSQAAKGGLLGGNALMAAQTYGQNLAGDVYQNQIGNLGAVFGMTSPYITNRPDTAMEQYQFKGTPYQAQADYYNKLGGLYAQNSMAMQQGNTQVLLAAMNANSAANVAGINTQGGYDSAKYQSKMNLTGQGLAAGVNALSNQATARNSNGAQNAASTYGYLSAGQNAYNENVRSQMGNMAGYLQYV